MTWMTTTAKEKVRFVRQILLSLPATENLELYQQHYRFVERITYIRKLNLMARLSSKLSQNNESLLLKLKLLTIFLYSYALHIHFGLKI